jgi:hypothetical protein
MKDYCQVMETMDAFVDSARVLHGPSGGNSYALGYLMSMIASRIGNIKDEKEQAEELNQLQAAINRNIAAAAYKV